MSSCFAPFLTHFSACAVHRIVRRRKRRAAHETMEPAHSGAARGAERRGLRLGGADSGSQRRGAHRRRQRPRPLWTERKRALRHGLYHEDHDRAAGAGELRAERDGHGGAECRRGGGLQHLSQRGRAAVHGTHALRPDAAQRQRRGRRHCRARGRQRARLCRADERPGEGAGRGRALRQSQRSARRWPRRQRAGAGAHHAPGDGHPRISNHHRHKAQGHPMGGK